MLKNAVIGVMVILLIVISLILIRTISYGSTSNSSIATNLPEVPSVDVAATAARLGAAIQIRTITGLPGDPQPGRDQAWYEFREFLDTEYPEVLAATSRDIVATHTLLYTWEGQDPSLPPLIFMAHQDVVPYNIGTEKDWAYGPFGGKVADGYVWGRGALDDKGSLITLMEAARALINSDWRPERTIIFLFGHDEEVAGVGAQSAFAHLKEKGVKPLLVLDEGMMALEEFPLTGKPAGLIGIAEKGYMSVRITALTQGGHSSTPPRESGAVKIARAIVSLEENQMPADLSTPPFMDMMSAISEELPFATKMALANRWAFEGLIVSSGETSSGANAMMRTTTAPTMLSGSAKENVLPQRASAVVNFRIHPSNTPEEVLAHINEVISGIDKLEIEVLGGIGSSASPVSSTADRTYQVLSAIASELTGGAPVAPALVVGATDSRYATAITEEGIYRFMPAIVSNEDLAGFHGTNERLSVENVGRMVKGYMQIMVALGGN